MRDPIRASIWDSVAEVTARNRDKPDKSCPINAVLEHSVYLILVIPPPLFQPARRYLLARQQCELNILVQDSHDIEQGKCCRSSFEHVIYRHVFWSSQLTARNLRALAESIAAAALQPSPSHRKLFSRSQFTESAE